MKAYGVWKALVGLLPNCAYLGWPHISAGLVYVSCLGEVFVLHPLSLPRVSHCNYVVRQTWTQAIVGATPGPTQLLCLPSPSWANIQIRKSIWTLTQGSPTIPASFTPARHSALREPSETYFDE